jgi:hypothetical protein
MDFDLENFTHRLIAETLFYDQEYGLVGSLSLVDIEERKEQYVASFLSETGEFLIEEATGWEESWQGEDDTNVAYALAIESTDYGTYEVPEEAAQDLLALAREHGLLPSVTVLFEDEEI